MRWIHVSVIVSESTSERVISSREALVKELSVVEALVKELSVVERPRDSTWFNNPT